MNDGLMSEELMNEEEVALPSPIEVQSNIMSKSIEELSVKLDTLNKRLIPVRIDIPVTDEGKDINDDGMCDVAITIKRQRKYINIIIDKVNYLLDTLQV